MPARIVAVALAVAMTVIAAPSGNAYPRRGITELIARFGTSPDLSADGRFLAYDDTRVHVRDLVTGEDQIVSRSRLDEPLPAVNPAISADGRFVAFESGQNAFVPSDRNGTTDIFVNDRVTGETERVSVSNSGAEANGTSISASISDDGRFVAFASGARNLTPEKPNCSIVSSGDCRDIFVHDRETDRTELISVGMLPELGAASATLLGSFQPSLSADGRFVAFRSHYATGGSHISHVFVRDLVEDTTVLVSVRPDGRPSQGQSSDPAISPDGRFVAFAGTGDDLVPSDGNGTVQDIFLRDLTSATTTMVSLDSQGRPSNAMSTSPSVSTGGRYVSFSSSSNVLAGSDTSNVQHVLVRDRLGGTTDLISSPTGSGAADANSGSSEISRDGRRVFFASSATNLAPGLKDSFADLFVRHRGSDTQILLTDIDVFKSRIDVVGWTIFDPRQVSAATDPLGDAEDAGVFEGADLRGATVVYRPEREDVAISLRVDRMTRGEMAAAAQYEVSFKVDGTRYEVRAAAVGRRDEYPVLGQVALYRCPSACSLVDAIPGDVGAHEVSVSFYVAQRLVGLRPGSTISDMRAYTAIAYEDVDVKVIDELSLDEASIPRMSIETSVSNAGTGKQIASKEASLLEGRFVAVFARDLFSEGPYVFTSRACFGSECDVAKTGVNL